MMQALTRRNIQEVAVCFMDGVYKNDGCHPMVFLTGVNLQNCLDGCCQGHYSHSFYQEQDCEVIVGSELGTAWFSRVRFVLNIKIVGQSFNISFNKIKIPI